MADPDKVDYLHFDEALSELINVLDKLIALLGEKPDTVNAFWITQLMKVKYELQQSDGHGILTLLSLYGGMGSFNDLALYWEKKDAKYVSSPESKDHEHRFSSLRSKAYNLANHIRLISEL